jgi:hypothetical protein
MSDRHAKSDEDMMEVLAHDIMRYEALSEQSDLFALASASALAGNSPNDQYTVIELNVSAVQNETWLRMYRNLVFSRDQQPNLNTISFSDEGVIPIKPVLRHHAVVSDLDQLYSYDHNEKIRKIL